MRQAIDWQPFQAMIPALTRYANHVFRGDNDKIADMLATAALLWAGGNRKRTTMRSLACYASKRVKAGRGSIRPANCKQLQTEDVFSDRDNPADVVALRIDFGTWYASLSARQQMILRQYAKGDRVEAIAYGLGLTHGRVSQIRGALRRSWERFQGDTTETGNCR